MTRTYTETVTLQEVVCANCGITFAAPKAYLDSKSSTGQGFYCPNGHVLVYGEGSEAKLQKQLSAEQERVKKIEIELTHVRDQLQASEREMNRHKKRIANGVCPWCNRSFVKLQQHMQSKHPEHAKTPNEPAKIDVKINARQRVKSK